MKTFYNIKKIPFLKTASKFFSTTGNQIILELPKSQTLNLDSSLIPTSATTNKGELMDYFTQLVTMRRMEYESDILYKNKEIRGFCHLYIGQESIAVGMEEGITKEDAIITAYREHCNHLARGDTPYRIIAEMMSRSTGSTQGKGGSMHYYNKKNNFYGGNGIVGAQIPVGTGIAFAMKYLKKPNVCFTMYGDGSSNQGQLFEACNMAGLWKLPVIYTIENNLYGMGTSVERASHQTSLMGKFSGYPGLKIDGQNVFMVREAVKFCKNFVLNNGPMFLEIETYRYQGHSMSDPGITYRRREEIDSVKTSRDCIEKVRKIILDHSLSTEKDLKEIEKKVRSELELDIEKIKSDPYPTINELYTHVYVNNEPHHIRGVELEQSVFEPKH